MRSIRRRRPAAVPALLAGLLATLVLVLVLVPGQARAAGGPTAPALGPVAFNPPTASLELPLDAYTESRAEQRLLHTAQNRLTTRCMARYGLAYAAPDPAPPTGPEDRHEYLFGLADPARAAAYGYDRWGGRTRPPGKEEPPVLTEEAHLVLYGTRPGEPEGPEVPKGPVSEEEAREMDSGVVVGGRTVPVHGCAGEGYRILNLPTRASMDPLYGQWASFDAYYRAKEDPRMTAVVRRWSQCMDRAGYPGIVGPYEVERVLGLEDPAGPAAVAAAVQDVRCKRRVNLVGIGAAVISAHQRQLLQRHAGDFALHRQQREARLALAATLV
ncbi:hypothetical protein [Streptomyces sp. NPDC048603]|uniref:hypothetical protein n=1 Tax=Streptomyces sp. NPDC048603 TaxID=3365577 RepID=UPI003716AB7A